jgi:hypothetical protein
MSCPHPVCILLFVPGIVKSLTLRPPRLCSEETPSRIYGWVPFSLNMIHRQWHAQMRYPGCTTTFRRNKDRRRHVRHRHELNSKRFPCPVVDCSFGSALSRGQNGVFFLSKFISESSDLICTLTSRGTPFLYSRRFKVLVDSSRLFELPLLIQ